MRSQELFSPIQNKEKKQGKLSKNSSELLVSEIMADGGSFDDNEYNLAIKFVRGEKQDSERKEKAAKILGDWWMNKYGFPFELKAARDEVLARKYGPSEGMRKSASLQGELLLALKVGDQTKIRELKKRYKEEFPEQLEGVEVLFNFPELLKKSKLEIVSKHEKNFKPGGEYFRDKCESQFLVTHFVLLNSDDKPFLKQFWNVMEAIARKDGTQDELNIVRRGIISQVSVDLILKELEMSPQLSHPKEDAFEKTDMWIENKTRVQIKGSKYISEPAIARTDEAVFPGVVTKNKSQKTYFNSKYAYEISRFRAKIKEINPDAEGILLVIPTRMIDFITGQPDEKLVEFFRNKLKEKQEDENIPPKSS